MKLKGGELLERIECKEYYAEKEARDFCIFLMDSVYSLAPYILLSSMSIF